MIHSIRMENLVEIERPLKRVAAPEKRRAVITFKCNFPRYSYEELKRGIYKSGLIERFVEHPELVVAVMNTMNSEKELKYDFNKLARHGLDESIAELAEHMAIYRRRYFTHIVHMPGTLDMVGLVPLTDYERQLFEEVRCRLYRWGDIQREEDENFLPYITIAKLYPNHPEPVYPIAVASDLVPMRFEPSLSHQERAQYYINFI